MQSIFLHFENLFFIDSGILQVYTAKYEESKNYRNKKDGI